MRSRPHSRCDTLPLARPQVIMSYWYAAVATVQVARSVGFSSYGRQGMEGDVATLVRVGSWPHTLLNDWQEERAAVLGEAQATRAEAQQQLQAAQAAKESAEAAAAATVERERAADAAIAEADRRAEAMAAAEQRMQQEHDERQQRCESKHRHAYAQRLFMRTILLIDSVTQVPCELVWSGTLHAKQGACATADSAWCTAASPGRRRRCGIS
jgi:flagellar biosynthesis GTPase FlhF